MLPAQHWPYSVTDANNCTAATGTFTVVEPAVIYRKQCLTVASRYLCNGGTATVTIIAAGGTAPIVLYL